MARIKPQALLIQSKKKKGPARIGLRIIITWSLASTIIVFSLYATFKHWHRRSDDLLNVDVQAHEAHEATTKENLPSYAVLNTDKGPITVELLKDAPSDVINKFIDLCQKGFFKRMLFRCVVENYVIQGGNFQTTETVEEWIAKGKSRYQIDSSPKHDAFMLGTSKAVHDDKSFDIFITTTPISDLNDRLVAFGRVVKGKDVVQEIEKVETDERCLPKSPVAIVDISLKAKI